MVYISDELTGKNRSFEIQIHKDGRIDGCIPLDCPRYMSVIFQGRKIDFYIEPGQTLAMLLDWEEFRLSDGKIRDEFYRFKNVSFRGPTAEINEELTSFYAQMPEYPTLKIYDGMSGKSPEEFRLFCDDVTKDYAIAHERMMKSENLSPRTREILQNNYKMHYALPLFEYEMTYRRPADDTKKDVALPLAYYDFLQNIPMNDRTLLSSPDFSLFVNRLEFCLPLSSANDFNSPQKTFRQYLFDELGMENTVEDEACRQIDDSLDIYLHPQDKKRSDKYKSFSDKYSKQLNQYKKKYLDAIKPLTPSENACELWQLKDSIYTNGLKLKPCIVYDIIKIRTLDSTLGTTLRNDKEGACTFLSKLADGIGDAFLRKEADRIFSRNFPDEKREICK
jgi:hypothetical protein